jgi:hypothetical protein
MLSRPMTFPQAAITAPSGTSADMRIAEGRRLRAGSLAIASV